MGEQIKDQSYTCPECQAGKMHLKYIPYYLWLGEDLITVPEFPAWVCDICGKREYDSKAVSWLRILLEAGHRRTVHRQARHIKGTEDRPTATSG
ncbi:MAG: YgiT-type zinc finger protein [Anaerolineales bacterium]|nr:YgiT-type zinc finger protein [Anaerolineales bacterium]